MALTVAEVLELPVLAAGGPRVRVGGNGLRELVRWVHVIEITEIAGVLRGGELVLSTGMGLLDPGFDGPAYLRSLRDAGAVALVVELGQHVQELPAALVRAARAVALPLVELTRNVRFVAITEVVHARILNEQYERLQFSQRVHEVFAALSVGAATTAEVLERASSLAGHVVVLEDLGHRAVAFAGSSDAGEVLRDWMVRSRRADTAGAGPEGWLATMVGPVGQRWGRLVVPERVNTETGQARLVLERAAETLTIARLIDRDDRGVTAQAQGSLLQDLVRGRSAEESDLRARARALGLPLRGSYLPIVVHVGVPRDGEATDLADGPVVGCVGRAFDRAHAAGLAGVLRPHHVGALLSASPGRAGAVLDRFSEALLVEARGAGLPPLTVATAAAAGTLSGVGEGFTEAAHVAEVAAQLPHRAPDVVYRSADLGARGLLWWLRQDPRLQSFIEGQLQPLLDEPAGRSSDGLALLRAYLEVGGSMTRLARGLNLSRPATYARIARLEVRLSRDLSDAESRLSLHLALLAHEQTAPGGR